MTASDKQAEFITVLRAELPETRIMEFRQRELESLWGVVVYAIQIGAIAALWKVFEAWVTRYANASIKISYPAEDDSKVEVTYTKLTKAEADRKLAEHPPKSDRPIQIVVSRFE